MKINVSVDDLQKKLAFANHAISSKSQLPVLSNVLLQTKDNTLVISATDLEIGIQTSLPAEITEEGGTTVPAKTFLELINSLPEEKITIETTDTTLTVSSKKSKSAFQTLTEDEFPKLYEEKGIKIATVTAERMKQDFPSVVFAASTDISRPALSGVLVKKEETGFLLVATDGYRLSLKHSDSVAADDKGESVAMIVPARAFREIIGLKEGKESVAIYISQEKNQILFEAGESILVGRLIEADFPNYERIIPTDHSSKIAFDREELLKAVKICSIFARETANIIKLSLKSDRIIVSSQTPSVGENTVDVEAKLKGEENEIAFNAKYLLDVLAILPADALTFEMTGPLNPGVFKLSEDESFLHLIMPIRIQQ
jgi:DNA polymerase III subunit beta